MRVCYVEPRVGIISELNKNTWKINIIEDETKQKPLNTNIQTLKKDYCRVQFEVVVDYNPMEYPATDNT